MVQDSQATTWEGAAGYKMKAQCKSGVRADGVSSLIVAAGERRGLLGVGFENMMRSWVMKWGAQQGLGVVVSRWLVAGKAKAQGRGMGWGAIACRHRHVCFQFAYVFWLSVSMRKVGSGHPFCVLIYMNSYMFHIYFIRRFTFTSFILLSYLIFDFVCLTLTSADIHGIAKYARTYIQRYTHMHTQKQKNTKEPPVVGLFCGKWLIKIRHPLILRHPVSWGRGPRVLLHRRRRCNDNQQITVIHFGENKRLHLESSKQNYYIISLWAIIKAIFIYAKWDERKRASAQIGLNWKRFYWRFVTSRYRSSCWMKIDSIIAHTRKK